MREITVKIYKFEELPTPEAREKAREWWRECSAGDTMEWDRIVDDAKTIGLRITSLDAHRANNGNFIAGAVVCAERILQEHGKPCETYKTAKAFLRKREDIVCKPIETKDGEIVGIEDELDAIEEEFLNDILVDYRIMLEKEIEYQNSDEQVDETIIANEYEFTADGRRARV